MNYQDKIVLATGNEKLHDFVINRFKNNNISVVTSKSNLKNRCETMNADCLIVSDVIEGKENIYNILLNISKELPNLRIIFLTKEIKVNEESKIHNLSMLVTAGIYDIISVDAISAEELLYVINNKKTIEDVQFIVNKAQELLGTKYNEEDEISFIVSEETKERVIKEDKNNKFVISSIKPGTGKSFVSTNVATAIAKFGVLKDGKPPRVAIIDADLQNLSVGTLLGIEDEKYNLITAIKKIATICSKDGSLSTTEKGLDEVKKFVLNCFKPYEIGNLKNLKALVGSQHFFEEVSQFVQPIHYSLLLHLIEDEFDVIIIDSNSSLSHITTQSIVGAAKTCYYVLNLDFNNVRNNIRYQSTLDENNILEKTKYILNEDISPDMEEYDGLEYTSEKVEEQLVLEAKIPMIKKQFFLNCVFEATPVILTDFPEVLRAQYELLKIANQIYPIETIGQIEKEVKMLDSSNNKRKSIFGFKI